MGSKVFNVCYDIKSFSDFDLSVFNQVFTECAGSRTIVSDSIREVNLDSHTFGKTDSCSDAVGIQKNLMDAIGHCIIKPETCVTAILFHLFFKQKKKRKEIQTACLQSPSRIGEKCLVQSL